MILRLRAADADVGSNLGPMQNLAEIDAVRLPVLDGVMRLERIDAADHVGDATEAELSHDLAQLLGDKHHEVDDVLGLAGEALAEHRVLRRNADRAGVEMANAHHHAARRHQRRGGETEFLGPEQSGNGDVAAGLELTVGLDADTAA